jgi:hypothetical protein
MKWMPKTKHRNAAMVNGICGVSALEKQLAAPVATHTPVRLLKVPVVTSVPFSVWNVKPPALLDIKHAGCPM